MYAPPPFGYARQTWRYDRDTTARSTVMAIDTWIDRNSALAPPSRRTRMISSVAYADELIASELKIARALVFDSRSPISSSVDSGRPKTTARARLRNRPVGVSATFAAGLATSVPGPMYRKYGAWGRSIRTRRSAGLRPRRGRRPPITWTPMCSGRGASVAAAIGYVSDDGVLAPDQRRLEPLGGLVV